MSFQEIRTRNGSLGEFLPKVAATRLFQKVFWSGNMASVVRRETRERTALGKLIKWAFVAFNIAMIIWIVGGLTAASKIQVHSAGEQAGLAIGSAIGVASLLVLWAIGDIILGILVLFSRGDKIITEE